MSILFVTDGTGHFKGFDVEIEEVIQGIFVLFYQLHPVVEKGTCAKSNLRRSLKKFSRQPVD